MDALVARCAILAAAAASLGASYRTPNFVVEAPTPPTAEQIGRAAEKYRRELAIEWLGSAMPNWAQPCPITAQVGDGLGAGGATSFYFEQGEVFGWRMTIQGSLVRILDSVLPHEVTHTIFATHFRQPLPRWADEGACTTVEHASERAKQQTMLINFLRTGHGIAFGRMFAMREYPRDVMPLYSQGYSVTRYLIAQGGRRKFLDFLADGLRDENWTRATERHYGFNSLAALQNNWLDWVRQGSPALSTPQGSSPLVAVKGPNSAGARLGASADRGENALASAPTRQAAGGDAPSVYQVAATRATSKSSPPESGDPWRPRRRAIPEPSAVQSQPREESVPLTDNLHPQHQVTRPQGVQRPRQVILEWSRPPGSDASGDDAHPFPGPG